MWKLKTDENGQVVLQDGKPVWINPDGAEVVYDPAQTTATIARLNNEAKTHRTAKETAEQKLAAFGDLDPEAARDAIAKMGDVKAGKLIEQGKLDEVKAALNKDWETKLTAEKTAREKLEAELRAEKIGGSFSRSKFLADNLIIPSDIAEATFGRHFKVEDGQVRAYDANGNMLYSPSKPGEAASFDEAFEMVVNSYPNKASILKATQKGGSGAQGGDAKGDGKTLTREQFATKSPTEKSAFFSAGGKLID